MWWQTFQTATGRSGPNFRHCPLIFSPKNAPWRANNFRWIPMGVSFSCVKNSITAHCWVFFNTNESKSPILNRRQHKPLRLTSHTPRHTKAQRKNRLRKIPLHGQTACARYLQGGVTLRPPHTLIICNSLQYSVCGKTVFFLHA